MATASVCCCAKPLDPLMASLTWPPSAAGGGGCHGGRRVVVGAAGVLVVPLAVAAVGLMGERRVDLAGPPTRFDGGSTTFPVPASGQALVGWLPDHTPVFIVRDRGDEVHVVRALSPYTQGIDVAVAWCEPTQAFVSVFRGDVFMPDGRYVAGPAASDLWTYQTRVDGGRIHAGEPVEPDGRTVHGDRPVDAAPVCFDETGEVNPDAVLMHDWPADRALVRTPEEAVTEPSGTWTLIEGYLVIGPHDRPRVCAQVVDEQPPRCPDDAPAAAPGDRPVTRATWVHHGLLRAQVDDATAFRRLEAITLGTTTVHDPDRNEIHGPLDLHDSTRVTVKDGTITVPAVDIAYGQPPPAIPAGTYQLTLDNNGALSHTLTSDDLGVDLEASAGRSATTTVDFPPGRHTFYCPVPGHRDAGMEFTLHIE